jgi:hypothetical protein
MTTALRWSPTPHWNERVLCRFTTIGTRTGVLMVRSRVRPSSGKTTAPAHVSSVVRMNSSSTGSPGSTVTDDGENPSCPTFTVMTPLDARTWAPVPPCLAENALAMPIRASAPARKKPRASQRPLLGAGSQREQAIVGFRPSRLRRDPEKLVSRCARFGLDTGGTGHVEL